MSVRGPVRPDASSFPRPGVYLIPGNLGGVPREQKMLKRHLPRAIYLQVYQYKKITPHVCLQVCIASWRGERERESLYRWRGPATHVRPCAQNNSNFRAEIK